MAKQANLKFSGAIGNVIFYKRRGGYYMRSKPATVGQTPATKASAGKFGKAVRISKALRSGLQPLFAGTLARKTILEFNNAIYKFLLEDNSFIDDIPSISGFEFNEQSLLKERLKLKTEAGRKDPSTLELILAPMLPDIDIAAPKHTRKVALKLIALSCNMQSDTIFETRVTEISIPYNHVSISSQNLNLPLKSEPGNMIVVGGALQYHSVHAGILKSTDHLRWQPAGILWAGIEKG